jgi:DNA repair photolyase
MYKEARKTLNPFVGCNFNCLYCYPSFRRQAKRRKLDCPLCYTYTPHEHIARLGKAPPKTKEGEFIFLCDMGDISFASPEFRQKLSDWCTMYPDRTFLIQSKNPYCFDFPQFPGNVILGTTIETNRDELCQHISHAPPPSIRYKAMLSLIHNRKMVTVEPVLDFDLEVLAKMIIDISPWRVYIGYDSHPKQNKLQEPSLDKTESLYSILNSQGLDVRWKLRRNAWWEHG